METSRVLVLTTTANAEDILLVIKMDNARKRTGEKQQQGDNSLAENTGVLREMETIQFESTENIGSVEYSEASLELIDYNLESHLHQVDAEEVTIESSTEQTEQIATRDEDGLEHISLTFKLSLNCNNGNVGEIESDIELEESDSEYTFTYEEVTDSEWEDYQNIESEHSWLIIQYLINCWMQLAYSNHDFWSELSRWQVNDT